MHDDMMDTDRTPTKCAQARRRKRGRAPPLSPISRARSWMSNARNGRLGWRKNSGLPAAQITASNNERHPPRPSLLSAFMGSAACSSHQTSTRIWPCAQQYVGKSQSCMVTSITGRQGAQGSFPISSPAEGGKSSDVSCCMPASTNSKEEFVRRNVRLPVDRCREQ